MGFRTLWHAEHRHRAGLREIADRLAVGVRAVQLDHILLIPGRLCRLRNRAGSVARGRRGPATLPPLLSVASPPALSYCLWHHNDLRRRRLA